MEHKWKKLGEKKLAFLRLILVVVFPIPWVIFRLGGRHFDAILEAFLSGSAIISAGFLLSWSADVARNYISGALAISIVALLAVLPEYAVDMYIAWRAGYEPEYAPLALANMTGANRLLIGIGWPIIFIIAIIKTRKSFCQIEEKNRTELSFLLISTLWSFTLFPRKELSILDAIIFIGTFVFYILSASKEEREEVEEVGVVGLINLLPKVKKFLFVIFMFLWGGSVILLSAERFAESLISVGKKFGISEFFLIQWVAPVASESPEFVIALIWALKGRHTDSIRTMISAKINQWTLLVGFLPLVYNSSQLFHKIPFSSFHLTHQQDWEIFLTSAQSIFAYFVLLDLKVSIFEVILLLFPFLIQFSIPHLREEITIFYFALTFFELFKKVFESFKK